KESTHDDMLDALADCLQLRIRPNAPAETPQISDPELAERMSFERRIQAQRAERGLPALDGASLRVALVREREIARIEEERLAMAVGAGHDELWATAGY
ncbi:MAG TPA: hypothetical protein VD948_12625, partial [Rhodothermales bacterium]|nr:hypothetical protein [Rhodothermales bacterium]